MRYLLAVVFLASLGVIAGCDDDNSDNAGAAPAVAIIEPERSGHLFDRPYPSDELLTAEGTLDLADFPLVGPQVGQNFIGGWIDQARIAARGYSAMTPVYLRFRTRPDVPAMSTSQDDEAVRLYSLDSDHRVPVRTRFIGDPQGDGYYDTNTLVIIPEETAPLRSGERYICVLREDIAVSPPGVALPAEAPGDAGVATVFTVQDSLDELRQLYEAANTAIDANPQWLEPQRGLREIASFSYEQGTSPSGRDATIETVRFVDGTEEVTYIDDKDDSGPVTIDFLNGPMAVYQGEITVPVFQDPAGRPYQSTGLGIINDYTRRDGVIPFDASGQLAAGEFTDTMRVVVQVPRNGLRERMLLWAHGSGGDAFEPVSRVRLPNNLQDVRAALAEAGTIIVSSDMNLFGARYPLADEGYSSDVYVNVGNLMAFRDNARQAAVEQWAVYRFATEALPRLLGESLPVSRVGGFGHSTGSQAFLLTAPMLQQLGPKAVMLSGSGGFIANYVVDSDLLNISGDIALGLFLIAQVPPPDPITPESTLGALFGVPEAAWDGIDRHHPLLQLFQTLINGADPLAVAAHNPKEMFFYMGVGDRRVPEQSTRWTYQASPNGRFLECQPETDYDGHYCVLRDDDAPAQFVDFVEGL